MSIREIIRSGPVVSDTRRQRCRRVSKTSIAALISRDVYAVIARRFEGRRYDCGSKAGFLEANVAFGRKHGLLKG